MSPSLLRRLLNGSCAPGAGSALCTNLNPSESLCCPTVCWCCVVCPVIMGGTFTDHSWVTGFNLLTCDLLPKGRDHSQKVAGV